MLLPFVTTDDQTDGGTVRLPRIVGRGNALHMILTGAPVGAKEALSTWVLSCDSDSQAAGRKKKKRRERVRMDLER